MTCKSDDCRQGRDSCPTPEHCFGLGGGTYLPLMPAPEPEPTEHTRPAAPHWTVAEVVSGAVVVAVLASLGHWIWINREALGELIDLIFLK